MQPNGVVILVVDGSVPTSNLNASPINPPSKQRLALSLPHLILLHPIQLHSNLLHQPPYHRMVPVVKLLPFLVNQSTSHIFSKLLKSVLTALSSLPMLKIKFIWPQSMEDIGRYLTMDQASFQKFSMHFNWSTELTNESCLFENSIRNWYLLLCWRWYQYLPRKSIRIELDVFQ